MKRNDMFMLAYIIFMVIAVVTRIFFDYQMWKPLVAAITCSSWMFAVADHYLLVSNEVLKLTSKQKELMEYALKQYTKTATAIDNRIESLNNSRNKDSATSSINNELEYLFKTKSNLSFCQNGYSKMEKTLNSIINKNKKHQQEARIYTVVGFLLFFCTITFEPISSFAIKIQDLLSVLAFTMILFTNYSTVQKRDAWMEIEETHYAMNNAIDLIRESFEKEYGKIL